MRKPYLCGNWKMNLTRAGALDLATRLRAAVGDREDRDIGVAPPFVYLSEVARILAGSAIRVGGQNASDARSGAHTGEISAAMLRDVGCTFVILGHSERRHVYGERDELVNRKVHTALAEGLEVILCIGETLAERQGGRTEHVVRRHVTEGLQGIQASALRNVTLAYEPVWAIGTGQNATPEQAGEVHTYVRGVLSGLYDERVAESTRIQYGGSVKPGNIKELMAVPGVDGALVGGAALEADSFTAILEYDR